MRFRRKKEEQRRSATKPEVHVHGDMYVTVTIPPPDVAEVLEAILSKLDTIGVQMSELQDAVTEMQSRVDEDVTHLLDLLATSQQNEAAAEQRALDAAANDAADAATIAQLTTDAADAAAARDELAADAAATVERIRNIDPLADFPPAPEPEPEPPTE